MNGNTLRRRRPIPSFQQSRRQFYKVVNVIWHKVLSSPCTNYSVVFTRWRRCASRTFFGGKEEHMTQFPPKKSISTGSAVLHGLSIMNTHTWLAKKRLRPGHRLMTMIPSYLNRLKNSRKFLGKLVVKRIFKNTTVPCICCYTTV